MLKMQVIRIKLKIMYLTWVLNNCNGPQLKHLYIGISAELLLLLFHEFLLFALRCVNDIDSGSNTVGRCRVAKSGFGVALHQIHLHCTLWGG